MRNYFLIGLATVAVFATVGCVHWQTPSVSFDFDNFFSIDNGGIELGIPVKVYIPFPGSGAVEPVEPSEITSYYVMPNPVPMPYIPNEYDSMPDIELMNDAEIRAATESFTWIPQSE